MTAKEKVRLLFPKATHKRYKTHGGRGYTLIWTHFLMQARLAEGKTTGEAWRNALTTVIAKCTHVWAESPSGMKCQVCGKKESHGKKSS
jgi:hypothetical protein